MSYILVVVSFVFNLVLITKGNIMLDTLIDVFETDFFGDLELVTYFNKIGNISENTAAISSMEECFKVVV